MAEEYYVSKKYHEISVLMGETAKKIAGNGDEWMNYLDTAARLYRYPFEDQMLIYAQRPDAAACALMEFWNEKMHCWVNRGAKGIALFDRKSERPRLRYVFDVSDVHKARRIGKDPYLWEIREEHKDTVLAQLEKTYGATGKDNSFEGRLIEIAGRIAQDSYEELLSDMAYAKENSFLEELDDLNVGLRLRETLSASIAYTLLSRCGADMDLWKDELNFDYISEFNTAKALSVIGNATTDMCKPLLIEIEKTVAAYDRHIARNKAKEKANEVHTDTIEKNPEKTLANVPEPRYNALKRESDLQTRTDIPIYVTGEQTNKNIGTEGIAHGTDIREERGLPDPQPDTQQRAGGAADKIRSDAQELPDGTPKGDLQRPSDNGRAESTLSGDTEAGRGEDGLPDRADGESRGSGRSTESVRSDEMGGEDEQHQALGGRNRTDGAGLQPVSSGTQLNRETEKPDNGEEHSLSGSFLQNLQSEQGSMELQKGILCSDEFLIHKRPEIAGYFAMEQDTRLQTDYLKNSFRMEEYTEFDIGEIRAGYRADEDGLTMWKGHYLTREAEVRISWEDARFFVNSYMEDGVYLFPGEKAEQIDTDGMYKQLDLFSMFTEQVGGIAAKEAEQGIIPAEKQTPEPSKNVLPKEQLDTILRSGGGRDNSRKRIYAKYRQGKTPEEMAEFLKKEYRTTGKGFEFDGKQLSVWFNEQGMTTGYGTSALENPKFTMSWQEIEKEIRSQVESGAYMGANEAYLVDEVERDRIATYAAYFFYDGIGEMPEEIFEKVGNRSDAHAKMMELLSSPEGIDLVASHMDKALAQLESGEKKLRFRSVMPKEELRAELDNLLLEKKTFPLSDSVEVKKEDFITQDEIDHRLGRGSGYEHGSFRIYDYFMEGHDSKEAVAFLKNEYGTGGQTHALAGADHSYENHDGKGIKLEKGSIMEPYTKVLLSWNVVEKRIRKLIQEDKYLSPKGKEAFAEYKEEQAQKALERAQEKMERDTKVSCKDAIDRAIARNFDGYRLPKGTAEGVIKEYGIERVSYVLANTVMHRRQEERISPENKEWAKSIEPYAMYESRDIVASSHPAILNGFINQARRYIEREKELAAQAETVSQSEYKQEQPRQEEKEQPEQDGSVSGKLTDLEKKAVETAKSYESLPLTEKIGVIAQTFGCTSGEIETSPCTGKWRGTSDISLRLDNGASLFLGNYRTPQAKNAKVHNECVNAALVRFNPEIVAVTIEAAIGPLKEREAKDNEIALQKGLKPYTLLNVEISDGTDDNGGYFGWYYVTLAVDGKIHAHLETGLNHEISHGKISKKATRENYFTAGAVKESDVDYVFNNVGFSSTDGSYSLPISSDVLERAKKELVAQAEAKQAQADITDDYEGELDWHTVHDMDDDNGQPTEWAAELPGGGFLWIDKETEGYALYDTHDTGASPLSVSETLDGAKENGEDYAADLTAVEVEAVEKTTVALESSEDFAEPGIGFYTHQYADGREGVRYRLVTPGEDGLLVPYLEHNRFFINRELAQEYIDNHADVIDVIGYDEIIVQSMQKQGVYKREQAEKETSGHNITSGHDVQKLNDTIFIDGQECVKTDEWKSGDDVYVLGNSVEDSDFFYAEVNGNTHFEYDHKPDRAEIEDDFINTEAMRDIDRHEAEVFSRFEGSDDYPDIDAAAVREKLKNGGAAKDVETMLDIAEKAAKESGEEPYKRFSVTETSDAYAPGDDFAIWDDTQDDYYFDRDGTIHTFATREEAGEYLIQVEKETAEKEAAEWAYVEHAKAETGQETFGHNVNPSARQKDLKSETQTEPKIDKSNAVNFRITDDALGNGGAKEKFRRNVEAIRTLEQIEGENRTATPEEQKILSQYVGWGGLADAFDESKSAWAGEYQELKSLLSEQEYASARESTLNAHYTSPVIIHSIYEALDKMGFEKGNVLEPAMGIGNFFGMLPEKMQESRLYGVELDGITGRIAKQLYPKADIKISGFEKTDYPNDFFDVAVGNVPFGQYKVADRQYDKNNFLIHDYFFAKALDKVRPGGVVAFVTSKGTMDKKSSEVRKYLAQRAELLGAVRLPNTAFKENAGTEVTSDILFLKKRDRVMDLEPDWVHLSEDENGIAMNSYFAGHPEMIVGKMEMVSGPHGMESTCQPDTTRPFAEQLAEAISRIDGEMEEAELDGFDSEVSDQTIPADPDVKNYSYTLVDDQVYYRENSIMKPVDMNDSMLERIKGMVDIRDCTQELIRVQLQEYPDTVIKEKQAQLNALYDAFSKKYGRINSQTNKRAFNQDSSYCLLCSLEKTDEEGKFSGKADMFTKRTIKKAEVVTSVDTATEALAVSLSEKARVDLGYMAELSGKTIDTVKEELAGIIFRNPLTDKWETADEYLSGNVRDKLETAKAFAENHPEYAVNVQALTQVQPKELDASEIEVRIGATWVKPKYMEDFMRDTFETPQHLFDRNVVGIQFSDVTGQWNVKGKNADYGNALVNMTYGTSRRNAYQILEDSLNLKDSRVYDTIEEDGKEKRVLNKKETTLAAQKQDTMREAFKDWIFRDPERRQDLVAKYNKLFNSTRPREYDGAHLKFPGMTPDIELKPHQKNAVAHVLYGDNTLLAHCVGAGKTFEMTAAAMESKRLGLCQKSLFVVPNHLTEQWASDFLRLYPGANILAATKKDFEPANRKKFCSRIATGDYDAVIIGHSQFEKIPLSQERQAAIIERQIDEIELAIAQAKADNGERYTIKQMEKTKKSLTARLDKLNDTSRKDNVVTFEQLGVDRLFVDESHFYKNLFLYTKMRNVAGIAQTEAQKSSDMFAKCQYLDDVICCEL